MGMYQMPNTMHNKGMSHKTLKQTLLNTFEHISQANHDSIMHKIIDNNLHINFNQLNYSST